MRADRRAFLSALVVAPFAGKAASSSEGFEPIAGWRKQTLLPPWPLPLDGSFTFVDIKTDRETDLAGRIIREGLVP